jgi:hypothetical protein
VHRLVVDVGRERLGNVVAAALRLTNLAEVLCCSD